MTKRITIEVDDAVYALLEVLTHGEYAPDSVEDVVMQLIDHAQQGVYRPGAWERDWLRQAFGATQRHKGTNTPRKAAGKKPLMPPFLVSLCLCVFVSLCTAII